MENSSPLVLEISSDEEAGFGDTRKGGGYGIGGGEFGDREDYDWLSKLLGEVGGNKDDDSDDVVLVSEVFPKSPKKSRLESLKPSPKVVGDECGGDDDCVVLDGDPDKSVVVVRGRADDVDDDDSDDLEIVGEKGEVACRDFPHPRHLCAKFLFASTPHEVHCGQCHCYVCDSLAPCSHWGTGISSIDHCHASDKEEYWRAERKRMKKGDKPVPVIPSISDTSLLEALIQTTQVPALAPPQPNSFPQNQDLSPVTIRPYSMSSNVSLPNAVDQGRVHPSGCVVPRYKPRTQLLSSQLRATYNNSVASRDKSHNAGSRSAQSFPHRAVFKRSGLVGALPNNSHAYGTQLSRDPSLKRCHVFQTPVMNGRHGSNQRHIGDRPGHSVLPRAKLSSPQSMDVGCANYLPSQPQIHSQPYSSCLIRDPIHGQSQTPSQPYVNSSFVSAVPLQPQVASQPSVENFENLILPQPHVVFRPNSSVPSQTIASYQSDAGSAFGSQLHSRSLISSHPNVGNDFENQSSQPQAHSNPTSLLIDGQNDFQKGNHTQNGIDVSPRDFGLAWDSSLGHGNLQIHAEEVLQCQSTAPEDNSQLQSITKNDHHQSIEPVDNFNLQSVVLADNSSLINDTDCQFPESIAPDSLDFQFDSWMFENHSLPGALEVPVSPGWNVFSPEPASIDTDWCIQNGSYMVMERSTWSEPRQNYEEGFES
ncbi:hypothetical protein Pfo_006503 [Paulownia fortunei]|nr:hypothetical protein Pfo_006503 [Paulownia fortunei]